MRVVLEITSPPAAGRKTVLAAGQTLKVGRTEWADFTVADDGHMSGVHFSLETDGGICYLADQGSSNGTTVNGQRVVEKVALQDGDVIEAGRTAFSIHIESSPTETGATDDIGASRAGLAPAAVLPPLPKGGGGSGVSYTVETCDTGLTLCRGEVEAIKPHELALRLSQVLPAFLIVDYNKFGGRPPEENTAEENTAEEPPREDQTPVECEAGDYLFDWLPDEAKAAASPVVLSAAESPHWAALVEKGWGNDAVICLFSRQEKSALLDQLRRVCRNKPAKAAEDAGGGPGGAMFGFCWPSVMSPVLANYKADFVRRLLDKIDAVLVEFPDLPITWQIYGDQELPAVLDQLGMTREEDNEPEA